MIASSVVASARSLIGKARYKRGSQLLDAPDFFDCSSLAQWVFREYGVIIPRLSIDQCQVGKAVCLETIAVADLIFTTGISERYNFYAPHMPNGVGHVGIVTARNMVICAMYGRDIIEMPINELLTERQFRGLRRIL
jgi:cell wall-associated NlpC family hydrolase